MSTSSPTLQAPNMLSASSVGDTQLSSTADHSRPPTPPGELQKETEKPVANPGPKDLSSPAEAGASLSPPIDGITPVVTKNDVDAEGMALCQQGKHEYRTRHGVMGILMAVACFPCGLICLFRDKEDVCIRCGTRA